MPSTPLTAPREATPSRTVVARSLVLLIVIWVAACAWFYFQQDQMTFPAPAQYVKATPMDAGIRFEDLHIPVNGSEQIHAWWIPASTPSEKVLLVFHGNGYVIEQCVQSVGELLPFHQLGVNLLFVDYRGYGASSPTTPNEKRVYEDARAAFSYLTGERKVPGRDIIILGRSIGTGPATEIAKEHPEAGGLILISPFTSIFDIAKNIWYLRPFPLSILGHNKFDNLSKIDSVHVPVFIAVGTDDQLTPPAMAQALLQKANPPKQLYLAPGAEHNHMIEMGGQGLESKMNSFIQSLH